MAIYLCWRWHEVLRTAQGSSAAGVAGGVTSFSRVAPSFDGVSVMRRFFVGGACRQVGRTMRTFPARSGLSGHAQIKHPRTRLAHQRVSGALPR